MISERKDRAQHADPRRQDDRDLDSREGDPRKRAQQDRRTSGQADGRPKDDPSRAPESGTP